MTEIYTIDEGMQQFIQNPAKFQITSRDRQRAENGEYYKMNKIKKKGSSNSTMGMWESVLFMITEP